MHARYSAPGHAKRKGMQAWNEPPGCLVIKSKMKTIKSIPRGPNTAIENLLDWKYQLFIPGVFCFVFLK